MLVASLWYLVVVRTPVHQVLYLCSALSLLTVGDLSNHIHIICKFDCGVAVNCRNTGVGGQAVQHKHTPKWCACAHGDGRGCVGAQSHFLRSLCEEVLDPVTELWAQAELVKFGDDFALDDCFEGRAIIHK